MTSYFKQEAANEHADFQTFMTILPDALEEDSPIKRHFSMKRTLDPNQVYVSSDLIAAYKGTDKKVAFNNNTSHLFDLVNACTDARAQNKSEMQDQFSVQNRGI